MGAAKNIFGSITNLAGSVVDKTKSGLKSVFKSADSNVIKTTSKTIGSTATAVSGGRSVVKSAVGNFASGVGSTAKVGGKVFGVTGILGGVGLAGAKIYDYVGDTWAITTAQREYENQIKLAGQEADVTKQAQDQQIDFMTRMLDLRNAGQDSSVMGASGGLNSDLFPLQTAASEASESNNIMWYALIALAVVGSGTYIYSKKMKGGKK
jgi:hypothetical protein